ncbi:mRNA 3'-end-processing protein YTH1 [Fusarium oxysporum f. sp. cubense race 1]|uniref:mRNA 3'-end-processing protein YTH1 n=1 Tax=Fusarium oxysporum f. sp. cubense (strain race 1) TaxID=1229664 RepID=N4UFM7_FUSC1|nr:mRNA 3'-end-processing protein YTH1 [Fusarium oxysporum f. sp. cubense race 1]
MSDKASSPKKSPKSPSSGASEVVLHDAGHWAALAQDEQDEDTDSSLGVDTESSTASMTSSILNYRTIKGRTYHSERGNAEYWASNDAQQNEAMDIIHHFLVLTLDGKLHLAPLKDDIKSVLDVGTGTGIWAIDFADEHPQAEVIGTDISPIQPSWVPPNVKFEIEDCTQPWTFSPDSFDFIYMRYLYGSISDWSALFQEAFRSCKPGGWVESFEASPCLESDDDTVKEGSAMSEWGKFFIEGGKRLGRTFTILDDDLQKQGMEDAGFADIQTRDFKLPIGSWPKDPKMQEIGNFAFAAMDQDLEGFVLYMASVVLGWSQDEVTVYCSQLRRELRSGKYHPYCRLRLVYGRKPETPTASLAARKCARLQPPLSVHLSVNEQWNGPGWLPPDIRVGIVFVNLTHPPDGVVCFLHKITDILLKQLVPLQSV